MQRREKNIGSAIFFVRLEEEKTESLMAGDSVFSLKMQISLKGNRRRSANSV